MKRGELLRQSLSEDKNVEIQVTKTLKDDKRFVSRSKRDIKNEIEDLEINLEERLTANTPIDKSTIEIVYANLKAKEDLLKMYEAFEDKFL